MYNFATGQGVSLGIIISGAITIHNSWRVIYLVGTVAIGVLLLLIIFTFPETAYNRSYDNTEGDIYENKKNPYRLSLSIILDDDEKGNIARYYEKTDAVVTVLEEGGEYSTTPALQRMEERIRRLEFAVIGNTNYSLLASSNRGIPKKKSYRSTLSLFTGEIYTSESLWTMFIRPFGLILLPPVLWATLVMSVLIGFAVAISSSCASPHLPFPGFHIENCSKANAQQSPTTSPQRTISHPSNPASASSAPSSVASSPSPSAAPSAKPSPTTSPSETTGSENLSSDYPP